MRRSRLELWLIGLLGLALVALLLARPGPGEEPRTSGSAALDLAAPPPCGPALLDLEGVGPPPEPDVGSIAEVVERLRDLPFREVPEPTYLPSRELARRVAADIRYPREEAELDARVLALLGAVPEGYDLRAQLVALAQEQVLGFYDPSSEELVVRRETDGGRFGPQEVLTLAHELGHALADQAVGLPDLQALAEEDPEAAAAAQALVEGDAMLVTQRYASAALPLGDQLSLAFQVPGVEGLEDVPHFLLRAATFPYTEGATFTCALYREGGWRAVDRAYARPPTTTAHILFPERYTAGEDARAPAGPRGLPDRWDAEPPKPLGAADLLFLFEAPGGDPGRAIEAPGEGAAAWDGGSVHVWTSGEQLAVALLLVQRDGEAELCSTMEGWYRRAFPQVRWDPGAEGLRTAAHDGRGAALRCHGDEVRLGIAPDVATAVRASH